MGKGTEQLNRRADQAWVRVRESPVADVYVSELYRLAARVVESIDAAWSLVPTPPPGKGLIVVNHEVHGLLVQALGSAAQMRALCTERRKNIQQSDLEHKVHLRRARWLTQLFDGIDLQPLQEVQVRNSLEHFDEYVDRMALHAESGEIKLPALVPIDMVLSSRHLLQQFSIGTDPATTYWVRAYISDERRFINCGQEIDIEATRRTAAAIHARLELLLGDQAKTEGSSILVLTAASFRGDEASEGVASTAPRPIPNDEEPR